MSARQSSGWTFQLHQGRGSEWKHLLSLVATNNKSSIRSVSPALNRLSWTNEEVTKYYYEYYYPPRVKRMGWSPKPTHCSCNSDMATASGLRLALIIKVFLFYVPNSTREKPSHSDRGRQRGI